MRLSSAACAAVWAGVSPLLHDTNIQHVDEPGLFLEDEERGDIEDLWSAEGAGAATIFSGVKETVEYPTLPHVDALPGFPCVSCTDPHRDFKPALRRTREKLTKVQQKRLARVENFVVAKDQDKVLYMVDKVAGEEWIKDEGFMDCREGKMRAKEQLCSTQEVKAYRQDYGPAKLDRPFSPELTQYDPPFYFCRPLAGWGRANGYENGLMHHGEALPYIMQATAGTGTQGLFFDVGMNLGVASLIMASKGHEVVGVEAYPAECDVARMSAKANGWTKMTVLNAAVLDKAANMGAGFDQRSMTFRFVPDDPQCAGRVLTTDRANFIEEPALPAEEGAFASELCVKGIAMDEEFKELLETEGKRIQLMKLDVDGNEYSALKGAEGLLRAHKFDAIQLELLTAEVAGGGHTFKDVLSLMHNAGYHFFLQRDQDNAEESDRRGQVEFYCDFEHRKFKFYHFCMEEMTRASEKYSVEYHVVAVSPHNTNWLMKHPLTKTCA
jgi:FkbM family methyltransferase